jgi:Grx4 family monothiol glutaredoxin
MGVQFIQNRNITCKLNDFDILSNTADDKRDTRSLKPRKRDNFCSQIFLLPVPLSDHTILKQIESTAPLGDPLYAPCATFASASFHAAATMSGLTEITSEAEFNSTLSSASPSTLLVLSFHAPWAAPCAQMKTILTTLASTYPPNDPPTATFLSINAEDLPEISESYDVTAVPFLVLLRDGKTLETVSGSDAAKVRDAVERHASSKGSAGKAGIPPMLSTTPRSTNGVVPHSAASNGHLPATAVSSGTKDPSGHAPAMTSGAASKEELHSRLTNLVKAAPVMLFMKGTPSAPQCGFSRQLVSILRENGVKYGFFNILADDEVRQGLKEFADWPTFPQLWIDGDLVGGLDIVSRASLLQWTKGMFWLTMLTKCRSRRSSNQTQSS